MQRKESLNNLPSFIVIATLGLSNQSYSVLSCTFDVTLVMHVSCTYLTLDFICLCSVRRLVILAYLEWHLAFKVESNFALVSPGTSSSISTYTPETKYKVGDKLSAKNK